MKQQRAKVENEIMCHFPEKAGIVVQKCVHLRAGANAICPKHDDHELNYKDTLQGNLIR